MCVFTQSFRDWLAVQPLWVRLLGNGVFVAVSLWLALATARFAFLAMAVVIALFTFNREDVRRFRRWLNG
jgi:hypothetical protein